MLSTSISIESPSASPTSDAPPGAAPGVGLAAGDGGERFALKLASAQAALPAGQNLAAGALPLQTFTLGPTLEVLTTPSAQPDGDSLAEFAKAQGLDDDVVAWLFADPALQGMPTALMAPPITATGLAGASTTSGATSIATSNAMASVTTGLNQGLALGVAAGSQTTTTALAQGTPAGAEVDAGAPLAFASTASTGLATGSHPATPPGAAVQNAALALASSLTPAAAWLLQQPHNTQPAANAQATGVGGVDGVASVPSFTLAAAIASATRATGTGAAAPQAPAATRTNSTEVEVLALEVEPELEQLWDADAAQPQAGAGAMSGDLDGAGTGGAGAQAQTGALPETSTIAQRASGYQALAERLGDALAQRVQSQVERGQWQVRMVIKPEKLGEIAIDLKMNAGAVDASFSAANPITRELLNDSLPRLREVLSGAGMDIADLNVASGRSQQSGGNPTPRHAQQGQAGAVTQTSPSPDAAPATPTANAARRVAGSAGWDVLV